jgi:hypothetical protein
VLVQQQQQAGPPLLADLHQVPAGHLQQQGLLLLPLIEQAVQLPKCPNLQPTPSELP